jgi:hypothetical protein
MTEAISGRLRGWACVCAIARAQSVRFDGSPVKNGARAWKW